MSTCRDPDRLNQTTILTGTAVLLDVSQSMNTPAVAGGHLALEYLLPSRLQRVIVISDGEPDDPQAAITAARALRCVISTYFCGDERNRAAMAFLRTLALCSRGGVGPARLGDLRQPVKLAGELRLLLLNGPAK
jgi:hypothetical protein